MAKVNDCSSCPVFHFPSPPLSPFSIRWIRSVLMKIQVSSPPPKKMEWNKMLGLSASSLADRKIERHLNGALKNTLVLGQHNSPPGPNEEGSSQVERPVPKLIHETPGSSWINHMVWMFCVKRKLAATHLMIFRSKTVPYGRISRRNVPCVYNSCTRIYAPIFMKFFWYSITFLWP